MAFKHHKLIKTQELPSMNNDNAPSLLKDFEIPVNLKIPIASALFRLKSGESVKYVNTPKKCR